MGRSGYAARRVGAAALVAVGDDDRLGPVGDELLDDPARELEHLLLGLLAVRGVRGVAEVVEILAGQLVYQRFEHADAAHAGIEDPNEPVLLIAIAAHAAHSSL